MLSLSAPPPQSFPQRRVSDPPYGVEHLAHSPSRRRPCTLNVLTRSTSTSGVRQFAIEVEDQPVDAALDGGALATAARRRSKREVLDFLVTEEQLGVTFVSAAIENAPGTPSEAFLPVLRNAVTQEYHHVEALKDAGGQATHDAVLVPRRCL